MQKQSYAIIMADVYPAMEADLISLYITSLASGEGKTALSLGLARHWKKEGKKVGYLRLGGGEDAVFAHQALGLEEEPAALAVDTATLAQSLQSHAQSRDIVLIEGGLEAWAVARAQGAKALLLAFYPNHEAGEVGQAVRALGEGLVGVVVNAIPGAMRADGWQGALGSVAILGKLPQERRLLAPSVGDLAQGLGGRLVWGEDKAGELVEAVMVGVYCLDPAPLYFGQRERKAALIKGQRPDMQLGALETPLSCLILTGDVEPNPYVRQQAEEKGVPILVVKEDVLSAMGRVEKASANTRFRQIAKLERLDELIATHLDWPALNRSLGLAS